MTKEETVAVLRKLNLAYPLFYSNKKAEDLVPVAKVWHEYLGMHDAKLINKAVDIMIVSETEVPTIALVCKYIPEGKARLKYEAELADPVLQETLRRFSK